MKFRIYDGNYNLNVEEYANIMKNHGHNVCIIGEDDHEFLEAYVIVDTIDDLLRISDIIDYTVSISRDKSNQYDGEIYIDDREYYD